MNLFEYFSVGNEGVVDLQYGRQQLKEVGVILPSLQHEQIPVVAVDSTL